MTIDYHSHPTLSVILPVRNAGAFLAESIESVLAQTYRNFELIVIYDHSTDNSLSILNSHVIKDDRIKLIAGKNTGLIDALNIGLHSARGQFIARMDADDVCTLDRFEEQIKHMLQTGSDICGSHFSIINESGCSLGAKLVPIRRDEITVYLAATVPFPHGSVMMKSSFIEKHNLAYGPNGCSEDYKLWVAFFNKQASISNCDKFLFKYRETGNSLSKRLKFATARDAKLISLQFIEENYHLYSDAVCRLLGQYSELSTDIKKIILIGSLHASIKRKNLFFLKVLAKSSIVPVGLFLFHLLK